MITQRSKLPRPAFFACLLLIPALLMADETTNLATDSPLPSTRSSFFSVELGGFSASQGQRQDIGITDLLGNTFTHSGDNGKSYLLGVGYHRELSRSGEWAFDLTGKLMFLGSSSVTGTIIQELTFENLAYQYSVEHLPLFVGVSASYQVGGSGHLNFELGAGPNLLMLTDFQEHSLDGISASDDAYTSNTSIALGATAGLSYQIDGVWQGYPLEIGYRFMYLGKSALERSSEFLSADLETGSITAHALVLSTQL